MKKAEVYFIISECSLKVKTFEIDLLADMDAPLSDQNVPFSILRPNAYKPEQLNSIIWNVPF
jgi:hypothetical protein